MESGSPARFTRHSARRSPKRSVRQIKLPPGSQSGTPQPVTLSSTVLRCPDVTSTSANFLGDENEFAHSSERPSGDQRGLDSPPPMNSRPVPSAFMIHTPGSSLSGLPPLTKKAIRLPSGDQSGQLP